MIENDLSFYENINDINFVFHDFPFTNHFDNENPNLFQEELQNNNFVQKDKEENQDIETKNLLMKKKVEKAKKMFNIKKDKINKNNNNILFKSENKKDLILKELILKNELLKKRNRISAQKSRNKKKEELKILYEQNEKLKNEVQEFHNKIDLLCSHCKCIFHEYNNENNSEYNSNNINISNETTNYMSSFSYISIQKIFSFSFIAIFTMLFTFILYENYDNNNKLRKLEIKMIEEKKIINNYTSIKNYPKIIIDDHILKKNYYMNFDDYLKLTNNNKDICHIDTYINVEKEINSSSKIKSTDSKKLNTTINYNSVYFKMFMPLCDKDENKHSHSDYYFLEKIDNENKNFEQDFYYEVKCKVMDFSKGFKT